MTTRLERDRKVVRNTYATADQDPGAQRFRGLSFDTWLEEERQAAIAAAPKPATPDHAAEAAKHLQDAANMSGQAQAVSLALASVEANLATAQAVERLNDNMAELAQGLASGFARFAETFGPTLAALAEAVSRPEVAAELRTANLIAYNANVSREVRWATSNGFAIDSPLPKAATEDASNAARMAREALGF